ncbi:unnamed protein product [Echinostoma caproni]|uniref:Zinc finger, C2H2 type n=1 Tax=Echinostoma caproni TaxID=27848 RepID=A0A183ADC8_9TREM|nr:unnamed protein product [Echinostoma caproni]
MSFSPPSDEYIGQTSSTVSTDFDMNRWPAIPIALDLRVNRCKRSVSPIPVSSEPVIHTAQISDTFGLQRPEFNVQQLLSATVQPIKPDSFGCIPTEQPPLLSDCKLIPSLPPLAPPPPTSLPFSTPTSTLSPDAALSLFQAMNALFQYLNQKSNNPAELLNHFPSQTEPVSFHPIQQLVKIESLQSPPIPTPPQPTFQRPMRSWPVDIGSRGYHPYKQQYHQHHHHPMRSHSHTPMDHCDRMVVRNASSCHPIPNITPITGRMKILGHDKGLPEHRPDKSSGHRFEPDRSVTDTTSSESGRSRLLSTDLSEEDAPGKGPIILYYPEPADSKNQIRAMLARNDPRLRYVNDGAAIRNPFAVDRKIQLTYLTNLLCIKTDDGGYLCKGCNRTTSRLRPMQQHLLSHSASKFNLCVRCLKGFNDKYDMKRHTRKHTLVRPYVCPECSRSFSQRCSLEGHRRKIHKVHLNYSRNQRREVVRVCESCGFACSSPVEMLRHTITFHPTSSSLPRLQRQLARMEERVRRSGLHSSIMRLHAPESSDPEAVPHRSMDERTEFETNCSSPNAIATTHWSDCFEEIKGEQAKSVAEMLALYPEPLLCARLHL